MSYCKLENTLIALRECEEELTMSDEEFEDLDKSSHEAHARDRLREMIVELAERLREDDI